MKRFVIYRSKPALLLLFAAYAFVALWTLPDYGITWDEVFHYISGDIYLEYFKTGELRIEENSNLRFYGPFLDILGALAEQELHKERDWLELDVARHLPATLLSLLIAPMVFSMVAPSFGRRAAFFSAIAFVLSPHFFSYMHNDPKDAGIAFFFTAFLWAAMRRARGGDWFWGLLAAVAFGWGFATKLSIVLAAAVVALWLLLQWPGSWRPVRCGERLRRVVEFIAVWPVIGLMIGIVFYPWLWRDTLHRTFLVFRYFPTRPWLGPVLYKGEIITTDKIGWDYALTIFTIQNPLWILMLGVAGALCVLRHWRKRKHNAGQLALIGIAVFMTLASLSPGGHAHDGLRQMLPLIPLLGILAGVGADGLWRTARRRDLRRGEAGRARLYRGALAAVFAVGFGSIGWTMIKLHPDQTVFFNALVGGTKGAEGRYEVEFYLNPYKRGMQWLHEHVDRPSRVVVAQNHWIAAYYNTPKITAVDFTREGEYLMHIPRLYLDNIKLPENIEEIHRIEAGGATILKIYRFVEEEKAAEEHGRKNTDGHGSRSWMMGQVVGSIGSVNWE